MNQYIKPTIKLSGTATNARSASSCSITEEEKDLIYEIVGGDLTNAFGETESGCAIPVVSYCKFTSGDLGQSVAFFS